MALAAAGLILAGGLEVILEFGSITFLVVSLLMALANYKIRSKTKSSRWFTMLAILGLSAGGMLILYYEFSTKWHEMLYILGLYALLTIGAFLFARRKSRKR
jgi:LPXTG-motif cell wall-anchored protein